MCKLAPILILFITITYAKGKLSVIKTQDNKDTPIIVRSITVRPGDNFTLSCKVVGLESENDVDNQVAWHRKNQSRFQTMDKLDSNEPSKLSFTPVTLQDRGTYVCNSTNESKSVYLLVSYSTRQRSLTSGQKRDLNYYGLGTNASSSDLQAETDKTILELLDSIDKAEKQHTSADAFSYNDLHNVDWNNFNEANDNWPSNLHWSLPEPSDNKWDFPTSNFSLNDFPSLKLDSQDLQIPTTTYEYRSSFRHFYYTVPLSIILILTGVVRLCYIIGRKSDSGWERLTASSNTTCQHRICVRRRNTNPSAGCMLQGRDPGRLSVLIIHRFTAIGANNNNNETTQAQADAPPSYDDLTSNVANSDLPPSYNEVLANMPSNDSTTNVPTDILPTPHAASTQRV